MKEILKSAKDFKIIPSNFKSSGALDITEIQQDEIKAKLELIDETEINDYSVGSTVEVFGVNSLGLLYFETKILSKDGINITLEMTHDYSVIQRREYSRVSLNQGSVLFKDISAEAVLKIEDISAGGVKLILAEPLELDKYYDIEIKLSNNMTIECALSPIRITEIEYNNKKAYLISGKFVNLENADRIVLVQYAFKIKMEEQSKENN
jgi:hypothetical protein